jgi:hypothetical protein
VVFDGMPEQTPDTPVTGLRGPGTQRKPCVARSRPWGRLRASAAARHHGQDRRRGEKGQ